MALARRCALTVAVDDPGNVAQLSPAAAAAGVGIRCYVEIDIGMARCGVADGRAALALARLVTESPGLTFGGLQTYEGHLQNVTPLADRVRAPSTTCASPWPPKRRSKPAAWRSPRSAAGAPARTW